jgi:hypothetical protein
MNRVRNRSAALRAAAAASLAAAAAVLALGAASASALVVHLGNGHTLSVQPRRGGPASPSIPGTSAIGTAGAGKLEYHGGPIMPSNTNYAVYWDPSGGSAYPAGYETGLNTFFEDLAHDSGGNQNVDSVATQYGDTAGEFAHYSSHFGGALVDTDPYPLNGCTAAPTCLTDAQLQEELKSYVKAHGLPHDLTHEYFLLTPPGVEDCFEATGFECSAGTTNGYYCAYHSYIGLSGGPLIYANDPYVTGIAGCDDGEHPNNKPSDGALVGGLSHEHNESITDPELNAWYGANGYENGDKCRTFNDTTEFGTPLGTAPDGSRYNQLINTREYWYQQEWSNEGLTCLQRLATSTGSAPTVTKVSPKTGPATGGTTVKITGTGFTGTTEVHFGSVKAAFKVNSSTSITATAPAEAAGVVDVTVTTSAGTSATSTSDLFKATPTVTSVSPTGGSVAGGTPVTIKGTAFATGAGATTFRFGTALATSVSCKSSTECTALTPKHAAATVYVTATVNSVKSPKTSAATYTYS